MALPNNYTNPVEYFTDAIGFLEQYAWIYQHSNTAFVKANVFESFPAEFKAYFLTATNEELNEFPLLQQATEKADTDDPLLEFLCELRAFIPEQAFAEALPVNLNANVKLKLRKMNLKKQHEITKLAQLIIQLCKDDVDLLIDFGAGLGYLSEMIFTLSKNKYLLLGLEAEAARVEAATKRQQEFMPTASKKCLYKQQFISESSIVFLKQSIDELAACNDFISPKTAIIGLHACADLTITAIKLFFEMGANMKRLIIMPCCYHKLEFNSITNEFRNFPLSDALKNIVKKHKTYCDYLNRPFLRLACQQTLARWQTITVEDHKKHGIDMLRRGIAEAIIDENSEYVVKRKNLNDAINSANTTESFREFGQFYELRSKNSNEILPWTMAHESKFNIISRKFGVEGYKFAEGLTCLQTALQKLCENVVLYDRLCYIQEYASANKLSVNVRYEKLLDEKLSPRCYVLIAEKL